MKMNDFIVEWYKESTSSWRSFDAIGETKTLMIRLAEILDRLEPQGEDNFHTIWAKASRPTLRQYVDYYYEEPFKELSPKEQERAKKEYLEAYPFPKVWHKISVKHFSRSEEEEFYALFVDYDYVFSINDGNNFTKMEGVDLLDWAIAAAEECIEKIQKGTYVQEVLDKIPFVYRYGYIQRADLWEADPERKNRYFKWYKKRDLKKFYKNIVSGISQENPFPSMTARKYFEACAVVYTALHCEKESRTYEFEESEEERKFYGDVEQTPKEMYYANADGRDNGLKDVPMDDSAAYEEWREKKGPYYEFNGNHPWEIIPSFSTSYSLHFAPHKQKDGRWIMSLWAFAESRDPDLVVAATALYDAGYPVEIFKVEKIVERLEGKDTISIIPMIESTFLAEAIHFPCGSIGKAVAKNTTWKFEEYRLKDDGAQ